VTASESLSSLIFNPNATVPASVGGPGLLDS
jgi:hypothetical protein